MRLGLPELLIILAIVLIIFGAGRLPALAAGLRKTVQTFRKGLRSDADEPEAKASDPTKPPEGQRG